MKKEMRIAISEKECNYKTWKRNSSWKEQQV